MICHTQSPPPRISADGIQLKAGFAAVLAALAPLCAVAQSQTPTLAPIQVQGEPNPSLTVPTTAQAREQIQEIPGGVEVVGDPQWRDTQASTIKDILDYTPGVFAQPKWGADTRLSIRGSGLSRYYHLRGINLYQDGVPLTNADGSSDFQWIDPTAYRYTEVYKGANALRCGASTLGGAINFVSPTGRDANTFQGRVDTGSFGWWRAQAATGFAQDRLDGFITGSWQRQDGYREQSSGDAQRLNGSIGWRLSDTAETRFFMSAMRVRQEIPGAVTREQALNDPRKAAPQNVENDWQRNVDGARLANRTVIVRGDTQYEFGAWYSQTHLKHPIYQYLDNDYDDYGAYTRVTNNSQLAGHDNRFTLGMTWSAGTVDANNYVNTGGKKGQKLSSTRDRSDNLTLYGENAFDIVPGVSLIAGAQYLYANRDRRDRYNGGEPTIRTGEKSYDFFNPKLGVLWQVDSQSQVYANVSRSAEPPTFGDMNFSTANDLDRLKPQRATTLEIGTRGQKRDIGWDVSLYRAWIKDEFQCVSTPWDICGQTVNLDRSIHQGLEAGMNWTFLNGLFEDGAQTDGLVLNAAYTFSDFRFDNDKTWGDNRIPGVPRHYLRAEVLYKHPSGFYVGPYVEWVPQAYFVDNANTLKTASYTLLGARIGWENARYSFYLEGRNLTNRKYIASASTTDRATQDSALFEPGNGRGVYAGVQMRY